MAKGCAHLQHPPKQLEMIELKLEIDSEKERKSKPKHDTHIMQVKGMERDKIGAGRRAHMAGVVVEWLTRVTLGEF